eukprot:gnl/TRDRNA2_/TRDRNA2_175858_c0_seq2.p1 gnl/TRDRNA2_/TRDRNA2_175858_c0~~gnl/TRDRNA2_/TRDRNA2_175858_c0_seq2.p1  ORF type:complete len:256 (+),score=20.72 gnl/TRDRNA2_/TRDRNA2_175858_c0_seq2:100-768(+)
MKGPSRMVAPRELPKRNGKEPQPVGKGGTSSCSGGYSRGAQLGAKEQRQGEKGGSSFSRARVTGGYECASPLDGKEQRHVEKGGSSSSSGGHGRGSASGNRRQKGRPESSEASLTAAGAAAIGPNADCDLCDSDLLGRWVDSAGNTVIISQSDGEAHALQASISRPPRRNIIFPIRRLLGGILACGKGLLDPTWSTASQLHWIHSDGVVVVWLRVTEDSELI